MNPQAAANLLRKLADRVEAHGHLLLNLPPDDLGDLDADGKPEPPAPEPPAEDYPAED
jgi:hypothetical protein